MVIMVLIIMQTRKVVEVVVCKTNFLIGHLKFYHKEGEAAQGEAEAGDEVDKEGEGAIGSFDLPLCKQRR